MDELRECIPCRFILLYPQFPWRALLMPACNIVLKAGLHGIRQRALRAGIEIDFALEDFESGTNLPHLLISQHEFPFTQISLLPKLISGDGRQRRFEFFYFLQSV